VAFIEEQRAVGEGDSTMLTQKISRSPVPYRGHLEASLFLPLSGLASSLAGHFVALLSGPPKGAEPLSSPGRLTQAMLE